MFYRNCKHLTLQPKTPVQGYPTFVLIPDAIVMNKTEVTSWVFWINEERLGYFGGLF
jgi:hypothetical protein